MAFLSTFLFCVVVCWVIPPSALSLEIDFVYHNFPQMTTILRQMTNEYPQLTKLYSIGKSSQGRELWVMLVTSDPKEEPILKPNVKYVANMHGNEAVGRELMLHLLNHLLSEYGRDEYVTWLLDNTRVHVMPSMNPDGFEASVEGECSGIQGRGNAYSVDLNRNFPDYFAGQPKASKQPETRAVMEWMRQVQFVLSANFHGGALVASYPFDNVAPNTPKYSRRLGSASVTPDDDVFRHLAESYSFNHKTMYLGLPCRDGSPPFPNGTTNGAAWYSLVGGMQDYNYVWGSCMEITLEISCCKYPRFHQLSQFWSENQRAMLQYLGEVHQGIWGQVTDPDRNPISNASVKIQGRDFGSKTTYRGEYWRILRPGTYTLNVQAQGYEPVEVSVQVSKGVSVQNITLYPHSTTLYEPRSDPTSLRSGPPSVSPVVHNSASSWPPTLSVNSTFLFSTPATKSNNEENSIVTVPVTKSPLVSTSTSLPFKSETGVAVDVLSFLEILPTPKKFKVVKVLRQIPKFH